jgi:hypothetical protein
MSFLSGLARSLAIPFVAPTRAAVGAARGAAGAVGLGGENQPQIQTLQGTQLTPQQLAEINAPLPEVKTERLGAPEEQAARSLLARQLMEQQQAAQRQLASQQARAGVRGGAAASQQARLARQLETERASQEQAAFLGQRQFNIQQAQREQFAKLAAELAKRQIQAGLTGQSLMSQAAREYGQAQLSAAQQGDKNILGTVICSELARQGYLDERTMMADSEFGRIIFMTEPEVMHGYWKLAIPVVGLMKKSKAFTWAVSLIAKPWARYMAYMMGASEKGSFFGMVIHTVGKPVCRAFGKKVIVYG